MPKHEFSRVRQDVVRRTLRVQAKQQITPNMLRISFHSDELRGFHSPSPDDHIKIFLPAKNDQPVVMRDFTPRSWDADANTFTLDFALHPRGPAVDWARNAEAGDNIEIGGPRGSTIAPHDFDWYLLIGDATALPSIGRHLEILSEAADVHVIALVENEAEEEYLAEAQRKTTWLHTAGVPDHGLQQMLQALRQTEFPAGDGFVWIAAETGVARGAYRYFVDAFGHPKEWIKAAGYWTAGQQDAGERIA